MQNRASCIVQEVQDCSCSGMHGQWPKQDAPVAKEQDEGEHDTPSLICPARAS